MPRKTRGIQNYTLTPYAGPNPTGSMGIISAASGTPINIFF